MDPLVLFSLIPFLYSFQGRSQFMYVGTPFLDDWHLTELSSSLDGSFKETCFCGDSSVRKETPIFTTKRFSPLVNLRLSYAPKNPYLSVTVVFSRTSCVTRRNPSYVREYLVCYLRLQKKPGWRMEQVGDPSILLPLGVSFVVYGENLPK